MEAFRHVVLGATPAEPWGVASAVLCAVAVLTAGAWMLNQARESFIEVS